MWRSSIRHIRLRRCGAKPPAQQGACRPDTTDSRSRRSPRSSGASSCRTSPERKYRTEATLQYWKDILSEFLARIAFVHSRPVAAEQDEDRSRNETEQCEQKSEQHAG